MELYLLQHGLALAATEDPLRPLGSAGILQVQTAARGIRQLGLAFELIICSPERRSQQTAALIAEAVRYPYSDILTSEALLPQQDPGALLALVDGEPQESRILVVGHLPQLARLAAQLLGGAELVFDNAGLTCLERIGRDRGRLRWHLSGALLAKLAG